MNLLVLYVQQFGHRQGGEQKSHHYYFIIISTFLYFYFFNSFAVYVAAFELGFSASIILYLGIAFGEGKIPQGASVMQNCDAQIQKIGVVCNNYVQCNCRFEEPNFLGPREVMVRRGQTILIDHTFD